MSRSKVAAIFNIEELLFNLSNHFPYALALSHSSDNIVIAHTEFQDIKNSLRVQEGPAAPAAAEALDKILKRKVGMDNTTHFQFFDAAGLGDMFKNTVVTIQDAIAMNMVQWPEAYQLIMKSTNMDHIDLNTRSKLQHSYRIQQRFLGDVGRHLLRMLPEVADNKPRVAKAKATANVRAKSQPP